MGLLRTIFALSVVFAHSPWNGGFGLVGGRNAVQLFYMISGFLISHVLTANATYQRTHTFYLNRALRLYPIYYAVALLSLLSTPLLNPDLIEVYRTAPLSAIMLLVGTNLLLIGQDWVMFSAVKSGQLVFSPSFSDSDVLLHQGLLVPQAWTLGLELTFYALAPFIVRRKRLVVVLLLSSLIVRALLFVLGWGPIDPWSYRFFPAELSLFLLGMLAQQYLLPYWQQRIQQYAWAWLPRRATQGLSGLCLCYSLIPASEAIKTPILFVIFLIGLPLTFIYQNESRIDTTIGNLSYPIYIGHMLIIKAWTDAIRTWDLPCDPLPTSLILVGLAMLFAILLHTLIGVPVEVLRRRVKGAAQR